MDTQHIEFNENALQLATLFQSFAGKLPEGKRRDICKAIAKLTVNNLDKQKQGAVHSLHEFTTMTVLTEANIDCGRKTPSQKMSEYWSTLHDTDLLKFRYELEQHFREAGQKVFLWPERRNPGDGSQTFYYLCPHEMLATPIDPGIQQEQVAREIVIDYEKDLDLAANCLVAPLLNRGYPVNGPRLLMLTAYVVVTFVAMIGLIVFWYLAFVGLQRESASKAMQFTFAIGAILYSLYALVQPILQLMENKIIMAPILVQRFLDDDAQLEISQTKDLEGKASRIIKLVRYHSVCPRCGGRVKLRNGFSGFKGRLIGHCMNNPVEHLYSFDFTAGKSGRGRSIR